MALALACAGTIERPAPPAGPPLGTAEAVLGPVVGHVPDRSARIWVEVDRPGRLEVVLTAPDDVRETAEVAIGGDHIAILEVDGLEAATRYRARLSLEGAPIRLDPPLEFRTFPRLEAPSRIRIALVSCARVSWDSVQSAWLAVAADRPDAVLWWETTAIWNTPTR